MKTQSLFLVAALIAPLAAQSGPGASTSTDYGVLAGDGASTTLDSEAVNTAIGRGLSVRAAIGAANTRPGAVAGTLVAPAGVGRPGMPGAGRGLRVQEHGAIETTDPNATLSCGTSASAPGAATPTQGAHSVAMHFAVAANTGGNVLIAWEARESAGASIAGSVDVDGDGTADWTGTGAANDRQSVPVTAGAQGITITITTNGSASVTGAGRAAYQAALSVVFVPSPAGLSCTWTSFGPQCVGSLAGADAAHPRGIALTLDVRGATPSTHGFLVVGTQAASPSPLPGNLCNLLVDRQRSHFAGGFRTDANGDATLQLVVPARAFTIDMQALSFDRAQQAIGSTNGLNLVCR